jgi:hypothetical protein
LATRLSSVETSVQLGDAGLGAGLVVALDEDELDFVPPPDEPATALLLELLDPPPLEPPDERATQVVSGQCRP